MARRLIAIAGLVAAAGIGGHARAEVAPPAGELTLFGVRESPYNHVTIRRNGSVVSFRRLENGGAVSAIDLANPRRQVIPYTASLFAPALVHCCPSRVLNVGLGAGAFERLFETAFAGSSLTTVEIDPMIVEIAETHTGFRPGPRAEVVIADGRRYLARTKTTWDWIVLDAYVKRSRVPPHLTTREFFELVRSRLTPRGVFVVNLMTGSELFQAVVKTLTSVFPQVALLAVPTRPNVIAMAVDFADRDLFALIAAADPGQLPDLRAWDVDFRAIQKTAAAPGRYPIPAATRVLTDDFAPVEVLETRRPR